MDDRIEIKSQKLFELGQRLVGDEDLRLKIQHNPLSFLRENDINVDDEFIESVAKSLSVITNQRGIPEDAKRAFSEASSKHNLTGMAPMPPSNLHVSGVNEAVVINDMDSEFQFRVNEWGLVLVVPENVLRQIVSGVLSASDITKALMTLLDKLASTLASSGKGAAIIAPILGIAAIWVGIQVGWILAETVLILMLDETHHKGVYLTWTWIGLGLTAYLPIPTPIT